MPSFLEGTAQIYCAPSQLRRCDDRRWGTKQWTRIQVLLRQKVKCRAKKSRISRQGEIINRPTFRLKSKESHRYGYRKAVHHRKSSQGSSCLCIESNVVVRRNNQMLISVYYHLLPSITIILFSS